MMGISSVLLGVPPVHWRIFSTVENAQYCGGFHRSNGRYSILQWLFSTVVEQYIVTWGPLVLWKTFSTMWQNTISIMEDIQYCGRIPLVLWRDIISAVEDIQYCGGISSVLWRTFSTISAVEGYHQCCGGHSLLWRDIIGAVEDLQNSGRISPVLWRTFGTVAGYHQCCLEDKQYCGRIPWVLWGIPSVV